MLAEEKTPLINEALKLIAQQKSKYRQLINVNQGLINQELDVESWQNLMAERNNIFAQLFDMAGLMQNYQKQMAENKIIQDELRDLSQVIQELKTLDAQIISLITEKSAEIKKELGVIHKHHELENAYHDFGGSLHEPQMFDKTK